MSKQGKRIGILLALSLLTTEYCIRHHQAPFPYLPMKSQQAIAESKTGKYVLDLLGNESIRGQAAIEPWQQGTAESKNCKLVAGKYVCDFHLPEGVTLQNAPGQWVKTYPTFPVWSKGSGLTPTSTNKSFVAPYDPDGNSILPDASKKVSVVAPFRGVGGFPPGSEKFRFVPTYDIGVPQRAPSTSTVGDSEFRSEDGIFGITPPAPLHPVTLKLPDCPLREFKYQVARGAWGATLSSGRSYLVFYVECPVLANDMSSLLELFQHAVLGRYRDRFMMRSDHLSFDPHQRYKKLTASEGDFDGEDVYTTNDANSWVALRIAVKGSYVWGMEMIDETQKGWNVAHSEFQQFAGSFRILDESDVHHRSATLLP